MSKLRVNVTLDKRSAEAARQMPNFSAFVRNKCHEFLQGANQ